MQLFKFITDTQEYYIYAESKEQAEYEFIKEYYPETLDDDLCDLYDIEVITALTLLEGHGRQD